MGLITGCRALLAAKRFRAVLLTPLLSAMLLAQSGDLDLARQSLEDLLQVRVTSVTKKEQSLSQSAAAAFVISREDIRRSGMTNIPDLLRMVPGVNVARTNASTWAIGIRGFNNRYSNKVLVLIDGRSVYTPTFSGVFWDQQSVPLEDIERIEIVRGPGGTVWGANAVNGVINIITRSATDTRDTLVSLGTGTAEAAQTYVRHGGNVTSKGAYRVFGRYFNVRDSLKPKGLRAVDGWNGRQLGFRSDWSLSTGGSLTVQGDLFASGEGQTITALIPDAGYESHVLNSRVSVGAGNLLGCYEHKLSNGSRATIQTYYSRSNRVEMAHIDERTADVELQYEFRRGSRQALTVGAGYRHTSLDFDGRHTIFINTVRPARHSAGLYNTFVQDEIRLTDHLTVTAGSKFEHNAFSGFEFEPSAQLLWAPNSKHSLWFSASRAVRQPSWVEESARIDSDSIALGSSGLKAVFRVLGNPYIQAPVLLNLETGYRAQVLKRLSLDISVFRSRYRRLETLEPEEPYFSLEPGPPHAVLPARWGNLGRAHTYGAELSAQWQALERWRLSAGLTYLHLNVFVDPSSRDPLSNDLHGNSPGHQVNLRSAFNFTRRLEWDTSAFSVGPLPNGPTPGYLRLDSRLGWRLGDSTELSLVGQNLLAPDRMEVERAFQLHPTRVQRSVFGKVTWRF